MKSIRNIPQELLITENLPEDLSVLIGQNGSGKSTLLNELSEYYLRHGKQVIAIANTIHDKFSSKNRNFKTLRGRSGRRNTRNILKKALEVVSSDEARNRLRNATIALEYVGFEPKIGFQIKNFNVYNLERLEESNISSANIERINYLLNKSFRESRDENIIWLDTEYSDFNSLEKSNLTELFYWEPKLKKLKIIERIEVFLKKDGREISMLEASSGELSLITSIVYLSTIINENSVILIDEPENSLHPIWQKQYSKNILDIFYLYQPKIIIATHSPIIVNGSELFTENAKIFKSHDFSFELQKKELLNIEELYFKFFDITTPENRFLSNRIVRLLNLLIGKKLSLLEFQKEIEEIENISYDPKQLKALESVKKLSQKIKNTNNG